MTHQELLLELKDISPPAEPGWWLIAPGYLIIAAVLLTLIAIGWMMLRRRKSRRSYTAAWLALEHIRMTHQQDQDSLHLARELAQWLKQIALLAFPRAKLEAVTGSDWLAFLDRSLDDESFSRGAGRVFADDIYRQCSEPDAASLLDLCERWLLAVKPRLLRRGQG